MSAEEIAKAFVQHYYQSRGMLFASFSRGLSGCLGCLDAPCRVISLRCERLGGVWPSAGGLFIDSGRIVGVMTNLTLLFSLCTNLPCP